MYIEVIYDKGTGRVEASICLPHTPIETGRPLIRIIPLPGVDVSHLEHAIIDVDEGLRTAIANGCMPDVRAEFISHNFEVNTARELPVPGGIMLPQGSRMRELRARR